uniref:Mitochondrial carnitine/acylcarnitine carrier protein CACL n=1 Tax=Aegilops tauschii TaxID=37682 RepID=R7W1N2_AEGTA
MGAPLASVAFQNAMVFQVYAILSRSLDRRMSTSEPPSYTSVALAGVGTGALQTLILSPVELVKIRLQLEAAGRKRQGPVDMVRDIMRREGLRGIYRGLTVTALRDAPSHGVYFWTYEYARERLAQTQTHPPSPRYRGVVDCFRKSVREEGLPVLWRGLGTAVARAFVVNGAIFSAYELALRFLVRNNGRQTLSHEFPRKHERDGASDAWKCRFFLVALSGKFSQEEGKNGLAFYGALVDDTELPFLWNPAPLLAVDTVCLPQPNRCDSNSRWDHADLMLRSPSPGSLPRRGEPHV